MKQKTNKVLFIFFLALSVLDSIAIVISIASRCFEIDQLTMLILTVVICIDEWELWHRPTVEKKEYVIINFDTGRIIGDSMFDANEFSKELNRYYEHKLMHEMKIVDAASFIKTKED